MEGAELWPSKTSSFPPIRDSFLPNRLKSRLLLYMLGEGESCVPCWLSVSVINGSACKYYFMSIIILLIL